MRDELKIWRENYVNIQEIMDEYLQLKERSQMLRQEVRIVYLWLDGLVFMAHINLLTFNNVLSPILFVVFNSIEQYLLLSLHQVHQC